MRFPVRLPQGFGRNRRDIGYGLAVAAQFDCIAPFDAIHDLAVCRFSWRTVIAFTPDTIRLTPCGRKPEVWSKSPAVRNRTGSVLLSLTGHRTQFNLKLNMKTVSMLEFRRDAAKVLRLLRLGKQTIRL